MKEVKRSHSGLGNRHYSESKHDTETHLNKTSHPHSFNKRQGYAVAMLVLIAFGIGLATWMLNLTNGIFHSTTQPNPDYHDPLVPLFYYCDTTHDVSAFSQRLTTYSGNNACGAEGILLTSNSTTDAIAISQTPIALDQASSHNLQLSFGWSCQANTCHGASHVSIFLTTNA